MRPPANAPRYGRGAGAPATPLPEPPSATGQYPDPVWQEQIQTVAAQSYRSLSRGVPVQPRSSAPPRRSSGWSQASGAAARVEAPPPAAKANEPPSPTGQYPGPVWAPEPPLAKASRAARPSRAFNQASATPSQHPLHFKELGYSDDLAGVVPANSAPESPTTILTNEAIYRIIREVAVADSGEAAYSAVSLNEEYSTPGNPAYQSRQFGLGFGLLLSSQASGRLGRMLALTRQRDPAALAEALGQDAESVLAVTNASTPEQRLQPVGGEPLWSPMWAERFRKLGQTEACQYAQNEEAIEGLFRPMWNVAEAIGITSERGLAMLFDRVVTGGLGEGLRWALSMAGPLRTPEQRNFALQTLGFESLQAFQASVPGLAVDGSLGVETYGALVAALRTQGLVSLPAPADYVVRLLDSATGAARNRLMRLQNSSAIGDGLYRSS